MLLQVNMPGITEFEGIQGTTDQDLGKSAVVTVEADLTQNSLRDFDRRMALFSRSRNYFFDAPNGEPYSPHRIYEMTQKLSLGALTMDGDVGVLAPRLEIRHKRNANEPFIPQMQAREFAIRGLRLKAIKTLRDSGALSDTQAFSLLGGKELEDELENHEKEWQKWLARSRKIQSEQTAPTQGLIDLPKNSDTAVFGDTQTIPSQPAQESRRRAPLRKRTIQVLVGMMAVVGMLLTSCKQASVSGGEIPTQAPPVPTQPSDGGIPTDAPKAPTPAEFSSTAEAPASSYRAPVLSEAEYLPGSGGSGRNEIITVAGVPETTLVAYEDAAYALAKASGHPRDSVELSYRFNGSSAWNMFLRDKATGNILWTQNSDGSLSKFPLSIKVDATGNVYADPEAVL